MQKTFLLSELPSKIIPSDALSQTVICLVHIIVQHAAVLRTCHPFTSSHF